MVAEKDFVVGIHAVNIQRKSENVFKPVICRKIQLWFAVLHSFLHTDKSFHIRPLDIGFNIACRHSAENRIDCRNLCCNALVGNCAVAACLVVEYKLRVFAV